jgi:DNA-binding GntR family transcriptional regulator
VELGLLETRPRKGAFVRVASAKELIDLFEVAAELEALACRLAAERLTDDTSLEIQNSLRECEEAAQVQDISRYASGNLQFHASIRVASANLWLAAELSEIEVRINPYRSMPYKIHNRLAKSIQEHREIKNAILDGNAKKAANLMRDHIMLQGQRLPLLLRNAN